MTVGRAVRACGTSLARWMALQCAKRTARRLALQCAALKRHACRLALRFSARSALRAGYWPTCLTDGHMVVNDHTRSAENWKCVWYFLRPIDGSSACAKRRYILVYMSFVSIRYYKAVLYAALHSYNLFVTWQHTSDYTLTGITYIHIYNNITYIQGVSR